MANFSFTNFQQFLYVMKKNVDTMEAAVDAGERDLGTLTTLKKSLLSKFGSVSLKLEFLNRAYNFLFVLHCNKFRAY